MKEKLEISKLKAETTQLRLTSFALIIGAIWALYTFSSLKETYLAESNVATYESKLAALQMEITSKEIVTNTPNKIGLVTTVKITNKGIKPIDVDLTSDEVFTVSKLGEKICGTNIDVIDVYTSKPFSRITKNALRSVTSSMVGPGVSITIPFYVEVDGPGVYFVSFLSYIPDDVLNMINQQEAGDKNEEVTHKSVWGVQEYVQVGRKKILTS